MSGIINSKKSDLEKIAECHRSAFPDSLSTKMGQKYLKKMIEWYLTDEKRFLFHIEENGKCAGYCGGMIHDGTQPSGSASGMIQYSFNDAVLAIIFRPWLLFHKEVISKYSLIKKNIRNRFIMKKKSVIKVYNDKPKVLPVPSVGLVVIGVSKEFQGKGFGSVLLQEFENRSKEMNFNLINLTVRNDNDKAIKAYERNGWIKSKLTGNSLEMYKEIKNNLKD